MMKIRSILFLLLTTLSVTVSAQTNDVLSVEWKNRLPETSLGGKAGVVFIGESDDYVITSSVKSDGECHTAHKVNERYEYRMTIDLNGRKNDSRTFTVTKRGTPFKGKSEQKDIVADYNSTYIISEVNTKIGSNESVSDGTYLMEKGNKPVLACIEITLPQDLNLSVNVNKALNAEISKTLKAGNEVYTMVFDTRRFSQLQAIVDDLNKQLSDLEAKANNTQDENTKKKLWEQQDRIQDTLLVKAEADLANAAVITIEGKGVNTLTIDPNKIRNLRPKAQLLYGVVVVEKEVLKEVFKSKYEELSHQALMHMKNRDYQMAQRYYEDAANQKDASNADKETARNSAEKMAKLAEFKDSADFHAAQIYELSRADKIVNKQSLFNLMDIVAESYNALYHETGDQYFKDEANRMLAQKTKIGIVIKGKTVMSEYKGGILKEYTLTNVYVYGCQVSKNEITEKEMEKKKYPHKGELITKITSPDGRFSFTMQPNQYKTLIFEAIDNKDIKMNKAIKVEGRVDDRNIKVRLPMN